MAFHSTHLGDMTSEVREIHRKILLLMEDCNPQKLHTLYKAQEFLAEWEATHMHEIRKVFENDRT